MKKQSADQVTVRLDPAAGMELYIDPQTHLQVTVEPALVPVSRIGEACRREPAVLVEPVFEPALRPLRQAQGPAQEPTPGPAKEKR